MSRRPSSWFAATGLLALAAAATPAQPPPTVTRDGGTEPFRVVVSPSQVAGTQSNPWRGVTTGPKPNPWRGTAVGSASAPWAKDKWVDVEFRSAPATGPAAGGCAACAGARSPGASGNAAPTATEAPAPRPACCQDQPTVVEGIGAFAPVPSRPVFGAAPQHGRGNLVVVAAPVTPAAAKLSGTWCREMPGMMTALAFTGDEMKVTLVLNGDGTIATLTLTADYAVTKDGTVHGVVTGADIAIGGKTDVAGFDLASLSLELQTYTDQPFAFRCRPTDGGLMVSNVRLGGGRVMPVDALPPAMMLGGKYRPVGGPLPTPKPTKLNPVVAGVCDGPCPGSAVLMPNPSSPVFVPPPTPAYGPVPVIAAPLPVCPAPVGGCPAPPAAGPAPVRTAPPPEVLETMTRVFGEMVNGPVPVPAYDYPTAPFPTMPPQVGLPPTAAMCNGACPAPGVIPTAYIPPPPPTAAVPAARPGQMPVGTWCREVGPLAYTVDVKDGHLTLTLSVTGEEDGVTITMQQVLTADAYLTRTDGGLVGLITGVDVTVGGKNLSFSDAESLVKKLPDMQKALADKPFALSFRVYDDTLVIGNIRLPSPKDCEEEMKVWASMAGRYKRSTGPLPKGKPVKAEAVGGMTLPSPRYLEHYPQYVPPDASFPLPRELARQAPDLPAATNAARGSSDVTVPPMNRPVALPEPVRPVELRETRPAPRRVPGQAQEVKEIPAARN